ncbi:hypothetical protein AF332_10845 [Sporosarcina globispora]|uniref:YpoC-like domain-containing protein n=1 Tax=Sporosarcina globispora TaxID=1459 RepID=A0A0M0GBX7_SPOGL|nr:hypothetical protein [Sporosarcina globispora]KON87268.1 hypothetical protein AF332_10845 [Sporosarcina globispora]
MTGVLTIPVTEQLCHTLFYKKEDSLAVKEECLSVYHPLPPLLYEAAFYNGIPAIRPWENSENCILALMKEWAGQKHQLDRHFSNRDQKAAAEPMKVSIGIFLQLLYWANNKPVNLQSDPGYLAIKPVNLNERLNFILVRPASYHSYIQLSELMSEMEKQYMKMLALDKMKKKRLEN